MSILGNLINGVFGGNDGESSEPKPCPNCASSCEFFPDACGECAAYKQKLIDALYDVAHLEEYYDRYEVVSPAAAEGTVNCPACGAPNPASAVACEFCGTQLREGSAKIQVASASEIPDPIQLAQDVIFDRQEVIQKYEREKSGFLENLTELFSGDEEAAITGRMSTDEVKAVAAEYGVSVSDYLQGLDNGAYLTASAKKKHDEAEAAKAAAAAAAAAASTAAVYNTPVQKPRRPAYDPRREFEPPRRPTPPAPPRPRKEKPVPPPAQHGHSGPRQDPFGHDGRPGYGRNDRPGDGGNAGHGRPAPGFGGRPGPGGKTGGPASGSRHLPGEKPGPGGRGGKPGGRGR